MEHSICINGNSFPAENKEMATELFSDALHGVLDLNSGNDKFIFHLDSNDEGLKDFELSDNFTFENFCDEMISVDADLALFLLEAEDKSPVLDHIDSDMLEEISEYSFYIKDEAVDDNCDIYSITWSLSGILLSLPTESKWSSSEIQLNRTKDGEYINEDVSIFNISEYKHGEEIYSKINSFSLQDVCSNHILHTSFIEWYDSLSSENKHRVSDKLLLACKRSFSGGEPLFKTLTDGIREVRFSAYAGGAIRILFKHIKEGQQAILVGFIKKSNLDGYETNIELAGTRYTEVCA
ncbi:hypothetical protein CS022_09850 [Veronia nyctiphanis]|uniref:Uncharacterized protein n=1 Tax=Veronia nyctiphanis TaxID=1278244 RepID=A0A4Q0YRP1_9GAMM|nr:type II toxin-antitoxin system RelE/ParE family toxin [Veronia nyctiphanis]RXJ73293.1 hypothetical protein CS022_09850 [Veronia nyctiphanis]